MLTGVVTHMSDDTYRLDDTALAAFAQIVYDVAQRHYREQTYDFDDALLEAYDAVLRDLDDDA